MTTARVVAVVVHWQDAEDTVGCVESLVREPGVEVLVVDNGAPEPAGPLLKARVPGVRCLRSPENRGYAGGANLGIREALAAGADVVALFNNDVRVHPGATAAACAALAADPGIAVVGAKVLLREDPSRLWLAWGRITWRQSLVGLVGAGARDGPRWDRPRDVEWIGGCALWFRRTALEAVGLFDERFFAYHEEVDWCLRARRAGWRVRYCPAAVVRHTGRGGGKDRRAVRVRKYFAARNTLLFARKHATARQWFTLAIFLAVSLPLQALRQWPRGRLDEVGLKLRGLRDAFCDRPPPFAALGLSGAFPEPGHRPAGERVP